MNGRHDYVGQLDATNGDHGLDVLLALVILQRLGGVDELIRD